MKNIIKPYKKEFDFSYTSGVAITIELIKTKPDIVEHIFIHTDFNQPEQIIKLCDQNEITYTISENVFKRVNQKENTYLLGVFRKYPSTISSEKSHVVLVNPADMGNLGTIIRTLVGFGVHDLAIITPAADIWNPKTVRASMGSLFHMRFTHYENIYEYLRSFSEHKVYTFMLDGELEMNSKIMSKQQPYSLVFGNEATGLDEKFRFIGTSLKIPQSILVDSLNLSIAVALGVYCFNS
ncbi:MAG: RNA methyltransferase [Oscillospiraceae bacterium]|nr:RNA methyltransferase [Oscillospiraceae bacterium]